MDQKSPDAFRTISEVAEWLGVPTHVLRFWESRFSQVKPVKRAGGRRYYRPSDMELLGGIRQLLHEDGMTIRGVQKLLREEGIKHVSSMSPPLESGDEGDEVESNVVDLAVRREETDDESYESYDEADDDYAEDEDDGEDDWTPAADEALSADEGEDEGEEDGFDGAVDRAEDATQEVAELASATGSAEAETAPEPTTAEPAAPEPAIEEPAEGPTLDDPNSPEAVEFFAHDAAPETFETADAAAPESGAPAPTGQVDSPSGPPDDPMTSPEALEFAAQDALPEVTEDGPRADSADSPALPRVALTMPDIGPDPDDGSLPADRPLIAARLRNAHADVSAAALEALADQLRALRARTDDHQAGQRHI